MKLFSIGLLGFILFAANASAVEIGKTAPDFTLSSTQGKEVSLRSFKGKYVVLEWFNYDCPFVKKHYGTGNMQALQKKYTDRGIAWLSINSSAPGKEGNYTPSDFNKMNEERKGAPTAILMDPTGKVGKLYGAKSTPHMFLINPKGELIYMGAIDDKPSTDKEDVATAKNYVSQAIDEALGGKPVTVAYTKSYGCSVKY